MPQAERAEKKRWPSSLVVSVINAIRSLLTEEPSDESMDEPAPDGTLVEDGAMKITKSRDAWGVHYVVSDGESQREVATILFASKSATWHGRKVEGVPDSTGEVAWDKFVIDNFRAAQKAVQEPGKENVVNFNVVKTIKEKQIVTGVVAVPGEVMKLAADGFQDAMTAEEIEKSAHAYLQDFRAVKGTHDSVIDAAPVESYIAPLDFTVTDAAGETQTVKQGSWVLSVKVRDSKQWEKVKKGDYMQFSAEGLTKRKPLAL